MHSPSSIEVPVNLLTHSSEPLETYTAGPVPVVSYFTGLVERLIHDNIDYALVTNATSLSIEAVHALPPPRRNVQYGDFIEPYRPLQRAYHVIYQSYDTMTGIERLGMIVAHADVRHQKTGIIHNRTQAFRSYTWSSEIAQAVYRYDFERAGRLTSKYVLYGDISDPLDLRRNTDEEEAAFKRDIMSVKVGEPIKPHSVSRLIGSLAMER